MNAEVVCQPVWVVGMGEDGTPNEECGRCGAYRGQPCRRFQAMVEEMRASRKQVLVEQRLSRLITTSPVKTPGTSAPSVYYFVPPSRFKRVVRWLKRCYHYYRFW